MRVGEMEMEIKRKREGERDESTLDHRTTETTAPPTASSSHFRAGPLAPRPFLLPEPACCSTTSSHSRLRALGNRNPLWPYVTPPGNIV
jgi:hypothetical protein